MSNRILIVEDNPRNLKLFRDILQANGYVTSEAVDGRAGLEEARHSLPDLILLDIMLPEMNGFEVCATLKSDERTRAIPVVAVSSFAMAGDRERAMEAGCGGYITKPIDVRDFLQTVKTHLRSDADGER